LREPEVMHWALGSPIPRDLLANRRRAENWPAEADEHSTYGASN